jgi:hypothetical protein
MENGTGTLTGIAAGQVTLTASTETTSAQAQVNILSILVQLRLASNGAR